MFSFSAIDELDERFRRRMKVVDEDDRVLARAEGVLGGEDLAHGDDVGMSDLLPLVDDRHAFGAAELKVVDASQAVVGRFLLKI